MEIEMTATTFNENTASAVAKAPAKPKPSKVRLAALMALAVYPVVTLYLYVLMPLTEGWALWQRTLVLVPLMVLTIVFLIAPTIQKHLGWFVARLPRPNRG
jgi:antibiotic biosynthesis monooxygenase (ABM) superfamily enzyme